MKEQLYDGPLDGLEIDPFPGNRFTPTAGAIIAHRTYGAVYERRGDGRLYFVGSKWEMK